MAGDAGCDRIIGREGGRNTVFPKLASQQMRTEKKQKEGRQDNKQSCERDHLFETRSTEVETLPRPTQRPVATYL